MCMARTHANEIHLASMHMHYIPYVTNGFHAHNINCIIACVEVVTYAVSTCMHDHALYTCIIICKLYTLAQYK